MSGIPESFNAFRIHNDAEGYRSGIESISLDKLSEGEVLIKTSWSGINRLSPFSSSATWY